MLTERQKAKIRKQNQERDKKFVESLNPEERELRSKYIAARDKADKLYAGFFEGKTTSEAFAKAELEKERCRKAYYGLVISNRVKRARVNTATPAKAKSVTTVKKSSKRSKK